MNRITRPARASMYPVPRWHKLLISVHTYAARAHAAEDRDTHDRALASAEYWAEQLAAIDASTYRDALRADPRIADGV